MRRSLWILLGCALFGALSSSHGQAAPVPPVFCVEHPTDGEHMKHVAPLLITHDWGTGAWVEIWWEADVLWTGFVPSGCTNVDVPVSGLPNGDHVLMTVLTSEEGDVLGESPVTVSVLNPVVDADVVSTPTSTQLQLAFQGMAQDQIYVVLAANSLSDSYFPSYGLELPIPVGSSTPVALGLFPTGYAGGTIEIVQTLGPMGTGASASSTIYLVLLTYQDGRWTASEVTSLSL